VTDLTPDAPSSARSRATSIREATFRQVLRGYRIDEVDRLLEDLAARIEHGGRVLSDDVASVTFRKGLKGYSVNDVDAFLERLTREIGAS
jgi:DivIVA domain-containing protein